MKRTRHDPPGVHAPSRGYSLGLELGGPSRLLFISGQVPADAQGRVPEGFEAQCEQAWANVVAVLRAAGMEVGNLVKVTTFLTDKSQVPAHRAIRRRVLGEVAPAATTMIAETLEPAWLLEIEAIAAA